MLLGVLCDFVVTLFWQFLDRAFVTPSLLRPAILCYMSADHPPTISSFVIRFVVEGPAETEAAPTPYHGAIRHVQSDEILNFSIWQDAVEFMQRYVPLEIAPKPYKE